MKISIALLMIALGKQLTELEAEKKKITAKAPNYTEEYQEQIVDFEKAIKFLKDKIKSGETSRRLYYRRNVSQLVEIAYDSKPRDPCENIDSQINRIKKSQEILGMATETTITLNEASRMVGSAVTDLLKA